MLDEIPSRGSPRSEFNVPGNLFFNEDDYLQLIDGASTETMEEMLDKTILLMPESPLKTTLIMRVMSKYYIF